MALIGTIDLDAPSHRGTPAILVIDDDEYVHGALSAALRGLRPRLLKARTAEEGLRLALLHEPDLAIIDVGLPDRDGYDLARELRSEPGLAKLRILILTGHALDRAAANAARVDGVISKPFRMHQFIEAVQEQLPAR